MTSRMSGGGADALLDGLGTLFGPVVGGALVVTLENYLAAMQFPVTVVIGAAE